jgi:hypothetical protein
MHVIFKPFQINKYGIFDTRSNNTGQTKNTIDIPTFKEQVQGPCRRMSLYNRDIKPFPRTLDLGRQCMRCDRKINEAFICAIYFWLVILIRLTCVLRTSVEEYPVSVQLNFAFVLFFQPRINIWRSTAKQVSAALSGLADCIIALIGSQTFTTLRALP